MEPLSKGHFGTRQSVSCKEAVLFLEVESSIAYTLLGILEVSFVERGCPFSESPLFELSSTGLLFDLVFLLILIFIITMEIHA